MTMPSQRQRDPMPWSRGGEIAFLALAAVVLAVVLAALLGLAAASALFGNGWVWPQGTDTIVDVVGSLLTGHPGRGLPPTDAARVPGRSAVYACVAVCELLLVVASIALVVLALRWVRPGDTRRGMATRAQSQQVLGRSRLRASAPLLRPDLHNKQARGSR